MMRLKSTSLVLCLCAALVPGLASAKPEAAIQNGPAGAAPAMALRAAGPATSNHGHFVCTAAINSGGGVFSGEYVNAALTTRLGTGTYQVAFNSPCPDVRIAGGWYRIAQPDTLTYNTLPSLTCTVADRYNVPSAIWVQCYNYAGALTDTSFTLHVSR